MSQILLILAVICFALAAINISVQRISIGWLGMFFLGLSFLV